MNMAYPTNLRSCSLPIDVTGIVRLYALNFVLLIISLLLGAITTEIWEAIHVV